jgi:hypothetical protein
MIKAAFNFVGRFVPGFNYLSAAYGVYQVTVGIKDVIYAWNEVNIVPALHQYLHPIGVTRWG